MPTYIMLGRFTDQGVRGIKDTTQRAASAREVGKRMGITVKDQYWTLGQYDIALVAEAPDDETMTAFGLAIGALGNVHTQTLRAFTAGEMEPILHRHA